MRTGLLLNIFFALFLFSCQNAEPAENSDNSNETANVEIVRISKEGPAQTTATLFVEGMMCVKACGGKISQELAELKGVSNTEISFEDGREINQASVSFDPEIISETQLIDAVNTIADGKLYKVVKVEITEFTPGTEIESSGELSDKASVLDLQSVFRFPNVFQMIRNFLVG